MDSKNLFRLVLAFAITAFFACGCSKEDPFEGPLGLQSRKIVLPAETGITPIMVFSNTTWTVSMTPKVSWAGIDRLSGKGSSGLYFSYAANYGEAREVTLAFEAGGVRDSVVVVQNAAQ